MITTPLGTTTITLNGEVTVTPSAVAGTLSTEATMLSGGSTSIITATQVIAVGLTAGCPASGTLETTYHVVEKDGPTTTTTLGGQSPYAPKALGIVTAVHDLFHLGTGNATDGDKLDHVFMMIEDASVLAALDSTNSLLTVGSIARVVEQPDPNCAQRVGTSTLYTNCQVDFGRWTLNGGIDVTGDDITINFYFVDGANVTRTVAGTVTLTDTTLSGSFDGLLLSTSGILTNRTETVLQFALGVESRCARSGTLTVPYTLRTFVNDQEVTTTPGEYSAAYAAGVRTGGVSVVERAGLRRPPIRPFHNSRPLAFICSVAGNTSRGLHKAPVYLAACAFVSALAAPAAAEQTRTPLPPTRPSTGPLPPSRPSSGPLPPTRAPSGPLPPSRTLGATAPVVTHSVDAAVVARLRAELGPTVDVIDTPHFRIAFTAGQVFVDHRAALFERTYDAFLRFFRAKGFEPKPPAERMQVVLFATRRELDAFARGHAPLLEGAEGMYLARQNRALFFNAYADAAYVRLTSEVSTYERDIARFRRDVTAVDSDRVIVDYGNGRTREVGRSELLAEIASDERKLREAKETLRQHVNGNNVSTTIHECAHQLSFNMGLLRADADTPHWLSEGIATLFESSLRGEVRDPSATNPERLATFRIARRTDRMIPLTDLLAGDGAFFSAAHPQAYAQSWVLTSFLLRERPAALREYMGVVRGRHAEEGTTIDGATRLRDFRAAFGDDLASFERSLSDYVDGL